ncbi:MAG: chorismate mutase [Mogibacterium sp.]|nr:chorismate mutase [Mogibacterium sp.]
MDMQKYRSEIDRIDQEMIALLDERMRISEKIARVKEEAGRGIVDAVREKEHLDEIVRWSAPDMAYYNKLVFSLIMKTSADHQRTVLGYDSELVDTVMESL